MSKLTLTSHQQNAFNQIIFKISKILNHFPLKDTFENSCLSLTGSAGTGKTFLTIKIAQFLRDKNISSIITAPTHKAVSVISKLLKENEIETTPTTIHSYLAIKPFIDYTTGIEKFKKDKTSNKYLPIDVLIVDESSMIGNELMDYLKESYENGLAKVILFVGDPYQLLPVDNTHSSIYELPNQYQITEIVRQARDSYIIQMANELKNRIISKDFIDLKVLLSKNNFPKAQYFYNQKDFLDEFYKESEWFKKSKIVLSYKNRDVDAFGKMIRNEFWKQKNVINPDAYMKQDKVRFLDACTISDVTVYTNNDEIELEFSAKQHNSTLGIDFWNCKAVNAKEQQIFRIVDPFSMSIFNDKLSEISHQAKNANTKELRNFYWQMFYKVRNSYANVQHIYSSTIHKSQGSTYEETFVDLFNLSTSPYVSIEEQYRLAYVAITRASKNVKILISNNKDFNSSRNSEFDTESKYKTLDMEIDKFFQRNKPKHIL